MGKIPCYYYI